MHTVLQREAVALTSSAYHPFVELNDLLSVFLKAAVDKSYAREGSIQIKGFGTLKPNDQGRQVFVDITSDYEAMNRLQENEPANEADRIAKASLSQGQMAKGWGHKYGEKTTADKVSLPIPYQDSSIGSLIARPCSQPTQDEPTGFLDHFAREVAYYIKRYEVQELALNQLGKNLLLVGSSEAMRRIDLFIERASGVDLPVVISGEFGSEKSQVACAIHYNSDRRRRPFVEVNCKAMSPLSFEKDMARYQQLAKNGTLYLNGIDELDLHLQYQLPGYLDSVLGQWFGEAKTGQGSPRVIASSSRDLNELAAQNRFSRSLLAEIDFLKIWLPELRKRQQDIPYLLDYTLDKYRRHKEQHLSDDAIDIFSEYTWPENQFEMERVIGRLTAMANSREIGVDDIRDYAPDLLGDEDRLVVSPPDVKDPDEEERSLIQELVDGDFEHLSQFHHGVQRALRFMSEHFQEEISLTQLSDQAFVSPSHLSFLFKTEVEMTFKTFLAQLRIEQAKRILEASPEERITDVALESGFGDLSHFEKTFKKVVGCSPRKYREGNRP